ncbi:hypothetical protein [Phytohabitans aurantiacus]|uniref:Uncharacterized protein n=1 Tax=Phytohabitans aurantiacus TaxID=3016789 RepID=A0ABQ5QT07_9ACTN|nr:hypothetical protein [Phytohabitans aurantiacus]GLH97354.1 hypothetical protein Pa4123_26290 [Phytohabitans aurantiacus]
MIIEYVSVRSGKVLDRITVDGDEISYETGKARQVVEDVTRHLPTTTPVAEALRSWSNGYTQLRPAEQ